jgi:hypothetical protein
MSWAPVVGENRDSDIKVFCFFSSEKKIFLFSARLPISAPPHQQDRDKSSFLHATANFGRQYIHPVIHDVAGMALDP